MKNYVYEEGKRAQEKFEEGMKALFQVPKEDVPPKKKVRKKKKMTEQKESK